MIFEVKLDYFSQEKVATMFLRFSHGCSFYAVVSLVEGCAARITNVLTGCCKAYCQNTESQSIVKSSTTNKRY